MSSRLRVLELVRDVAGSVCGRLFAGLGHDVVTVALDGDLRDRPPFNREGVGLAFVNLAADKRATDALPGSQGFERLLAGADVLIVDLLPNELTAFGIDADGLLHDRPELVVVWITCFGRGSEFSGLRGNSLLAESYGGLATMIGERGRKPLGLGGEQAAHCAGVTGFLGAMLALLRRDGGHGGDVVEVAMCDVAAYMDWKSDVNFFMTGAAPTRMPRDAGEWRLVRCADGWIGFIFLSRHWPALVELVDDDALRDPDLASDHVRAARSAEWWPVIERWAAGLAVEDVYARAQALGLPFGWVVNVSDLLRSTQLRGRGFVLDDVDADHAPAIGSPVPSRALAWRSGPAPVRPQASEWSAAASAGSPRRALPSGPPLDGVVVLDFGTITAGAAVTRLLADYGATVIKVEWLDRPDTFRTWKLTDAQVASRTVTSPYFASNNLGKLDVAIDLKTVAGRDLVRRLAGKAHIVVENFRVGVTERLGIDEKSLRAINPRLIYLSLSSQGQDGPEAANSSFGSTLDLLSGLASITGYEDGGPMWSSYEVNYPDQLVSLLGAAALVYSVQQGHCADFLDVSQREVVSWTLATQISDYLVNGRDSLVNGNRRPGYAPHDTFPTDDPTKWVAISCADDQQRAALARWLGAEAPLDDAAWWDGHYAEGCALVAERTAMLPRDELVKELLGLGVPAVPVLDAADRAADPRFADRLVTFAADTSTPPVKGFPMRFGGYTPTIHRTAPGIGQDTSDVLREFLDISPTALEGLAEAGAIHQGRAVNT